jgi:serine phosphatase RsbU (regulator of sigma subunit)/anti-sigma regulatory factor (Ser/Thr protein kinase)
MTFLSPIHRASHGAVSPAPTAPAIAESARLTERSPVMSPIDIAPNDPLLAYLQSSRGAVDLGSLELDSDGLRALRQAGVALVVPLVAQGELIGTLNLGPRLSEQEYSSDDRQLLASLAAQAAPAVRVAQLVQLQAQEVRSRERLEQEMRVATLIQQQFLPRELPSLPGWQVAAYYGPARAVGGDFYDFIDLPDGRIGITVGDVTDKGVPAALIMARTQSILRGEAPRLISPARVLQRANELLVPDMPAKMFVTCLYGVLEPATGRLVFANAGHNLPCVRTSHGVIDLRATGMPLGLLPDMPYDEHEAVLEPGDSILLYSDGLVEAHDTGNQMFGFPRLRELMATDLVGSELLDHLLDQLHRFTGRGWEQEDDITLVALVRTGGAVALADAPGFGDTTAGSEPDTTTSDVRTLLRLTVAGQSGNERAAMDEVAAAVAGEGLSAARLERLKTAVSEATMNAIEYGSQGKPEEPVEIEVTADDTDLVVRITDRALSGPISETEEPDIEEKLAGRQKPRGWGLFLIRHMVDAVEVSSDEGSQTVELRMHRDEVTA